MGSTPTPWCLHVPAGEASASDAQETPCPVCGQAALVQLHGVVACPAERWQLDLRSECITLDELRDKLAGAHVCALWAWLAWVVR